MITFFGTQYMCQYEITVEQIFEIFISNFLAIFF